MYAYILDIEKNLLKSVKIPPYYVLCVYAYLLLYSEIHFIVPNIT
jgi:hypothetical protein